MYKTNEEFAKAMSELLFSMRIEETIPYGNECEYVPMSEALKIVDDPAHIVRIKKRIYENVLADVNQSPQKFTNEYGKLGYTTDTYDHAFSVDAYVDEVYTEQQEALEKLEEDQRQARLKVRYVVRLEVERIEYDPELNEEEFIETDSGETAGSFDSFEDALKAQAKASNLILKGY